MDASAGVVEVTWPIIGEQCMFDNVRHPIRGLCCWHFGTSSALSLILEWWNSGALFSMLLRPASLPSEYRRAMHDFAVIGPINSISTTNKDAGSLVENFWDPLVDLHARATPKSRGR
ncbi:hypothetical protein Nepgr_019612 [Nepenthes gracilis]|uniref:Uncharacterized protein n=1 Tax=Nepenthes gracilis TaxID=150966 RepID=A0AAD3SVL9_NEPGR|nr:hypothetical protein Nepgr_019612 [Nepenthes gracilis]